MGPIFSEPQPLSLECTFSFLIPFPRFQIIFLLNRTARFTDVTDIFMLTIQLFKSIFTAENLASPGFLIYFALAIASSSHIALSKETLKEQGEA
jgi:hypothetical protein